MKTSQRTEAKQAVGEFVVNEILRFVEKGNSPVSGRGQFKKLTKEYAKDQKGGSRLANLELEGDMLDSLEFKNIRSGIEVGIFKSSGEVPKADGHNNFSGNSKLPVRRFIADKEERFKKNIEAGIVNIVKEFETDDPDQDITSLFAELPEIASSSTGVQIEDILGANLFDDLFNGKN